MAASLTVISGGVIDAPAPPEAVPLQELVPWAILAGLLLVLLLYFVGAEQGATSLIGGHWVHEFVHDARHTLAFPCH
jgi:putative cobalt transporter subunit CbtB